MKQSIGTDPGGTGVFWMTALAVALLSFCVLTYEVLLSRIFSDWLRFWGPHWP